MNGRRPRSDKRRRDVYAAGTARLSRLAALPLRKHQGERRARALLRRRDDVTAVEASERCSDVQAETVAAASLSRDTVEAIENIAQLLCRQAPPAVGHRDGNGLVVRLYLDPDVIAGTAVVA